MVWLVVGVRDSTRKTKVILYQSAPGLCQRLAASLGTRKNVELTVRRSVDVWLNETSMLEASSRQVDEFVLHPSLPKNLARGQAYLVQAGLGSPYAPVAHPWWRRWRKEAETSPSQAVGVHLAMLPPLPPAEPPRPRQAGDRGDGLRLYEKMTGMGSPG
jgi:hypothetical protein